MSIHAPRDLFIAGRAVGGEGETFAAVDPGTETVVAEVAGASTAQVEAAISAAQVQVMNVQGA